VGTKAEAAIELWTKEIGDDQGAGEWFEVTQEVINQFADVTHDHQFIHVDPEQAAQLSPWGTTIAHGFLTLSMLTHLNKTIPPGDMAKFDGVVMGVNYGFDKVRFITPVKVGQKIRATGELVSADLKDPQTIQTTRRMTVEIDGEERPALVADWLTRVVYA
jgi:acyl dehydratase